MITIECPSCNRSFQVNEAMVGRTGRCPCGARLPISRPARPEWRDSSGSSSLLDELTAQDWERSRAEEATERDDARSAHEDRVLAEYALDPSSFRDTENVFSILSPLLKPLFVGGFFVVAGLFQFDAIGTSLGRGTVAGVFLSIISVCMVIVGVCYVLLHGWPVVRPLLRLAGRPIPSHLARAKSPIPHRGKRNAEIDQICWYHLLCALLVPVAGVVWGLIRMRRGKTRTGRFLLSYSAAALGVLVSALVMFALRVPEPLVALLVALLVASKGGVQAWRKYVRPQSSH